MFSCIVTILLTAIILRYIIELENRKCPCSLTWQHRLIKYFAPVIIIVCLLTLLMGQKGVIDLTRKHRILGVLYMVYATVGIFYAVTLVLYFLKLRYSECECARDWKQYGLLYPVIGFALIMLVLLIINAIMVFGLLPKLVKKITGKKPAKNATTKELLNNLSAKNNGRKSASKKSTKN